MQRFMAEREECITVEDGHELRIEEEMAEGKVCTQRKAVEEFLCSSGPRDAQLAKQSGRVGC
jgi:hypothetical protein